MQTRTNHERDRRVRIGNTGSIAICTEEKAVLELEPCHRESLQRKTIPPELINLFEKAITSPQTIPERFPRLTFLAIAISILVTALTAELDYLRGAGYLWP